MTMYAFIRRTRSVLIILLVFGCGTDPNGWTDARRLSFMSACETEALKQREVTELFAHLYCDCIQGQIEERYTYVDYIAHEMQYVQKLDDDNTILTCQIVAHAKMREDQESEPIDPNPRNPRINTSAEEEFTSTEHHFKIRRPRRWSNRMMDGQVVWHTAAYEGEGPDNCFVRVADDWSFGVIGNDGYLESVTQEEFVDMLKVRYDTPIINVFDIYRLGDQDALRAIYTGTANGVREVSFILQTVRGSRLYTFGCAALADDFPNRHLLFQRIADTFKFTQ